MLHNSWLITQKTVIVKVNLSYGNSMSQDVGVSETSDKSQINLPTWFLFDERGP